MIRRLTAVLLIATAAVTVAAVATGSGRRQNGFLIPPRLQPRPLAQLAEQCPAWRTPDTLTRAVAIALAESQGYVNAYNDNLDTNGNVVSRDVGLWQINIPASEIGTQTEKNLYVPANNLAAACQLYQQRGFEPWVAYTTGVYLHDTYIQRALLGVANLEAAQLVADARAAGQSPRTLTPWISIPQLRRMYPGVPLP